MMRIAALVAILLLAVPVTHGAVVEEQIAECLQDDTPDICLSMLSMSGYLSMHSRMPAEELVKQCRASSAEALCISVVAVSFGNEKICSSMAGTSREFCLQNFRLKEEVQGSKAGYSLIWSALAIISAGIIVLVVYVVRSNALHNKVLQRDEDLQLQTYILNSLNQGYERTQLRKILLGKGWDAHQVDRAFIAVKKPKKAHNIELLELENYIMNSRNAGIGDEQTKKVLISDGWNTKEINDAFSRLK